MRVDLYGRQYEFVACGKRFAALIGGIGSGKTVGGAARAGAAGLGQIGLGLIGAPNTGMVTAPTYNVLRDATLPTFMDMMREVVADMTHSPPINVTLINGSRIMFRSAERPELLRGPSLSWWWGDEAALYRKDVFRIMIGRLRQGGQVGCGWLTTTPKGRNWLYQEFVQKQRDDYVMFRVRTRDNPFVDLAFYEMLAEAYTGDFARQELDGDFVSFEGLIYPEFDVDSHTSSTLPAQFAYHVAGVDWGYVHPGVINVYGVDGDGRMWLRHEEVARKRRIESWVKIARELDTTYNIQTFYCDSSEPAYIEQFSNAGLNATEATKDVLPGIQAVKSRLVVRGDGLPRLIYGNWCRHNITEKEQYQWAENRDGFRDMPKKINDDCCDAERYAVMGVDGDYLGEIPGGIQQADEYRIGTDY